MSMKVTPGHAPHSSAASWAQKARFVPLVSAPLKTQGEQDGRNENTGDSQSPGGTTERSPPRSGGNRNRKIGKSPGGDT